jgi:hypothetical protein
MSKNDPPNPSDAQATTAQSPSGASNTKEKSMNVIDLLKLNVNDHTEKKNGLTYLSWAWAWAEALKADPAASFTVQTFDGKAYMDVNGTGLVWVTVTMFEKPMTCMLPVMNHRNQPIPAPNAFEVNTAIMRCMTKALALHGLGLYIYSGDDLPMQDAEVITKADTAEVEAMVTKAIEKAVETGDADLANKELFADGMIKYCDICKDMGALKSYWKANQGQLDDLKRSHNDLYKKVLAHFTNVKATFNEKEKSDGTV